MFVSCPMEIPSRHASISFWHALKIPVCARFALR